MLKLLLPKFFKDFLKIFFVENFRINKKLIFLISPYLTNTTCIDVGASYFPHGKWFLFLNSNAQWIAVEPNKKNLTYIDNWPYTAKVETVETGLSKDGGKQVLYVTNTDSGSSLYPPVIEAGMKHRIKEAGINYLFPVKEIIIETITLAKVIQRVENNNPIIIKLDTQGTELSILQGATDFFDTKRIIGIEMESTLLAQPVMQGSAKFWQACEYLEGKGFELIDIDVIRSSSNRKGYLNECDAVFTLRRDIVKKLNIECKVCLFAFYVQYNLFEEAVSLLDDENDMREHFSLIRTDLSMILKSIKK